MHEGESMNEATALPELPKGQFSRKQVLDAPPDPLLGSAAGDGDTPSHTSCSPLHAFGFLISAILKPPPTSNLACDSWHEIR